MPALPWPVGVQGGGQGASVHPHICTCMSLDETTRSLCSIPPLAGRPSSWLAGWHTPDAYMLMCGGGGGGGDHLSGSPVVGVCRGCCVH
jgi:hypothetical protein